MQSARGNPKEMKEIREIIRTNINQIQIINR